MALARGPVVGFTSGTWTAEVRMDGGVAGTVTGVKTARNIASGEMSAGRKVLVETGETGHSDEWVVVAVWTA